MGSKQNIQFVWIATALGASFCARLGDFALLLTDWAVLYIIRHLSSRITHRQTVKGVPNITVTVH